MQHQLRYTLKLQMPTAHSISAPARLLSLATAILLFFANCGLIEPTCQDSEAHQQGQQTCRGDDCCGNGDDDAEHPEKHHCTPNCCLPMSMPFQYVAVIPQADQQPVHIGIDAFDGLPMEPAHSIFHPPRA